MRTTVLLPLTALVGVLAGCGSEGREQTARAVPKRDLTLVTQTAQVKVASRVEIERLRIQRRTAHPSQWATRPASASRSSRQAKIIFAAVAASTPTLAVPEPIAHPASTASTSTSDNNRELLPGKTVTVIPASSGASAGSDTADELTPAKGRTKGARGGGTCRGRGRGRGPGIGMAPAPRPDFR